MFHLCNLVASIETDAGRNVFFLPKLSGAADWEVFFLGIGLLGMLGWVPPNQTCPARRITDDAPVSDQAGDVRPGKGRISKDMI